MRMLPHQELKWTHSRIHCYGTRGSEKRTFGKGTLSRFFFLSYKIWVLREILVPYRTRTA